MACVRGVPMSVVDVVGVIEMGRGLVAAVRPVFVAVVVVHHVDLERALVPMTVVAMVCVAVVDVVGMVPVEHDDVPASLAVHVVVHPMGFVSAGRHAASFLSCQPGIAMSSRCCAPNPAFGPELA